MARASQIYLVYRNGEKPLACFTVKYESQDWAERHAETHGREISDYKRFRTRDGGARELYGECAPFVECPWE